MVSMLDERPLQALVTHTSAELRQAIGRVKEPGAEWVWGSVLGGAGKVEAFGELLERFAFDCRTGAVELVSDRGGNTACMGRFMTRRSISGRL